jgi:tRNA A-37 threonylcarbamoyl transferase component Bud32
MLSNSPAPQVVAAVAIGIAKMHHHGIYHSDLTIQNILVVRSPDSSLTVSVIDFDKAMMKTFLTPETCIRQLRRLDRSLLKWLPEDSQWRRPMVRLRFAAAYCRQIPEIRPFVKAYFRQFKRFKRRYRMGWVFQSLLGQSMRRR